MAPALAAGDFVLVKATSGSIPNGTIVVAHHPLERDLLIVKRSLVNSDGYWLASDNEIEGSDSRDFGTVSSGAIVGVVTMILEHPRRPVRAGPHDANEP
jgi:phage repressor protein C with HTH and peptisase S24 domain